MKNLIGSSLALCLSLGFGIGGAQAACSFTVPSQLAKLPFVQPAAGTEIGFAFDNEHYTMQTNFPLGGSLVNNRESSLMISTFNPTTGAFTGTMNGPWAGALANGAPVTGTIRHTGQSNFPISFSYSAPVLHTTTVADWSFDGAFLAFVLPGRGGQPCQLAMRIAGTYSYSEPSGQSTAVFGPTPFSGVAMMLAVP